MPRRVLFVDDELNILEGLRHRLHRLRHTWQMHFAGSGAEALEILAREPIDVVVSDMRMPEMSGEAFLRVVREKYPRAIRIFLSGHSDMEAAMRSVSLAHQFVMKPAPPGVIETVVERACSLQALINDEAVERIVGRIDRLPPLPRTYADLTAALSKESTSSADVARILSRDTAMAAKTLQIVNSAFFGIAREVTTIEEAVAYLGFDVLRNITLGVEVFAYPGARAQSRIPLQVLQDHALAVGDLAARLLPTRKEKESAFVAGLLHDIGKLVLVSALPALLDPVLLDMEKRGCPMHVSEHDIWGATHAEIGGYLLSLWGLPHVILEAVAYHHAPERADDRTFGILAATHVANALVHELTSADSPEPDQLPAGVAPGYLEHLGVRDNLTEWRALARRHRAAS